MASRRGEEAEHVELITMVDSAGGGGATVGSSGGRTEALTENERLWCKLLGVCFSLDPHLLA